jgi:TIR domain
MIGAHGSEAVERSKATQPHDSKLHVFISYSRDDLAFADQLDAALQAYGYETFIDRQDISGGLKWRPTLSRR